jgi:hypothetical protein
LNKICESDAASTVKNFTTYHPRADYSTIRPGYQWEFRSCDGRTGHHAVDDRDCELGLDNLHYGSVRFVDRPSIPPAGRTRSM